MLPLYFRFRMRVLNSLHVALDVLVAFELQPRLNASAHRYLGVGYQAGVDLGLLTGSLIPTESVRSFHLGPQKSTHSLWHPLMELACVEHVVPPGQRAGRALGI
jgi:hypothetical protein